MGKRILLLLCLLFCLSGCQNRAEDITEESTKESRSIGIYYPKIDEKEIGRTYNGGLYSNMLLYYDGRIYTSVEHYTSADKSALVLNSILGDELGEVSGNHRIYWSSENERLAQVTEEGTLYRIKDYDESFCVGVYYESSMPLADTYYCLAVFQQLNDITLEEGRELFDERFHFDQAVRIVGRLPREGLLCGLPPEDTAVKEFIAALNEGVFLDPAKREYQSLDPEEAYTLSFYDTVGMVTDIAVYESGYVTMESGGGVFVLRVDADRCKEIIDRIEDAH